MNTLPGDDASVMKGKPARQAVPHARRDLVVRYRRAMHIGPKGIMSRSRRAVLL